MSTPLQPDSSIPAPPCVAALPDQTRWFKEQIEPHETKLRSWLRGKFPGLRDVDDIVQEAYYQLMRARSAGPIRYPESYLFSIARNIALNLCRKNRNYDKIPLNDLQSLHSNREDIDVVRTATVRLDTPLVIEAIKTLPARCREVVVLHTQHQLPYSEIAARLGITEEAVRTQMTLGIKRCIEYLRRLDRKKP